MFIIYGKDGCPYCTQAIAMMRDHNFDYTYKDVVKDPTARLELQQQAPQARTVPQIVFETKAGSRKLIGTYTDLKLSRNSGELQRLVESDQ